MANTPATQRAVTVTVRVGLRKVLGIDLDVAGQIRLPRGRGYVLAHNLVSPLDAFVIALALAEVGHPEPVVMMRGSMRSVPFLGPLLAAGALVFGEAGDTDSFGAAQRAIEEGRTLIHAPEPVVSRSLEIGSMRSDPVRLATASDCPLVPAVSFGAHRLFDDQGRLRLRRGIPVNVTFGSAVPVDGSLNFNPTLRMLRMDMEALLGQTLNDYPRKEYGEGSWWWPASRHGGAPSVLDAMDDPRQVASPSAELWADDQRVATSRYELGASVASFNAIEDIDEPLFLKDAPLGEATWSVVPVDDGSEPTALMFDAEGDGVPEEMPPLDDDALAEDAPVVHEMPDLGEDGPTPSRAVPITSRPPPTPLIQPPPVEPRPTPRLEPIIPFVADPPSPPTAPRELVEAPPDQLVEAPTFLIEDSEPEPAEASSERDRRSGDRRSGDRRSGDRRTTDRRSSGRPGSVSPPPQHRDTVRQTVHGVTGLIAFDMPGNPRQLMRKVTLSATRHDLLIEAGADSIAMRDVEIDREQGHSFFWGSLAEDHVATSGEVHVTVPAGTRTTFVAARRN